MAFEMCKNHRDHRFKPVPSGIKGVSYYDMCVHCQATKWDALRPEEYQKRMVGQANSKVQFVVNTDGEWERR